MDWNYCIKEISYCILLLADLEADDIYVGNFQHQPNCSPSRHLSPISTKQYH